MLLTNAQTRLAWIVIYEGISSNLSHDPVPVPLLTLVQQRASGFLPVAMKTYERLRCCCLWQELESSSRLVSNQNKFTQSHCPQPNKQTHDNRILRDATKNSLLLLQATAAAAVCVSDSPGSSLASFSTSAAVCLRNDEKINFHFCCCEKQHHLRSRIVSGICVRHAIFGDSNHRNCLMWRRSTPS
uniref:(northern house mosquito) hypothetical protein n=1 Tax=Culex pipiens TaxID=7175 RepID=A0A8D8GLQ2_CULPI